MKFIEVLADGADAGVAEDRRHTETVALLTDSRDSRHAMRDKKRDATGWGYAVGSRAFRGLSLFSTNETATPRPYNPERLPRRQEA
jgi:hypothetical protein